MKQIYPLYGIPCRNISKPILFAFSLSIFILLLTGTSHAQAVNAYARVTAIDGTKKILTITSLNESAHTFIVGQQLIVIQMQDNVIGTNTANDANFGKLNTIANAGNYEVATISAINVGRTTITLTSALSKTYTIGTNSSVQVVSFRTLNTGNYATTANITAVAWSSSTRTGGVVAIQVGGTLTLQNNITADGQGFGGGARSTDDNTPCEPATFQINSTDYGAKGEGIYLSTNTAYNFGRARLLNGGGGGNPNNAGGAGGGNYTTGGDGGAGWTCSASPSGGLGGISLSTFLTTGTRLFMGGGGGGGQGNNTTQTAGGAGGGIIIIKAAAITTNCTSSPVHISANGSAASNSGGDGAGGAGAGGTIYLEVNSYTVPVSCKLQILANGGNGGNVNSVDTHGGGGGGGQGAILFKNSAPGSNVSYATLPGKGGLNSNGADSTRAPNGVGSNNSGIIPIGVVLPVRLTNFSAEKSDQKALLRWTAAGEVNTLFTVQHATDGVHFTTIGTVNGTGNGITASNYTFIHPNPAPGKNYYQLQITGDPSTRTLLSTIVSVNMSEAQSIPVAWPNPAHDHFTIRVNNDYSNKNHQVIITNLSGKTMYTNSYKPANGIITVTPAQQLKPGLYMFKITSEGYEQAGKLIIR